MRKLLLAILIATAWLDAHAQSTLPPCPTATSVVLTNCFGRFALSNGQTYVGEVRDGKWNGQGTYTWPDGKKYVGEWKDGKYNGQGTYTWPNGKKYVGAWKENLWTGFGTRYSKNGDIAYQGIWLNGKLIEAKTEPQFRYEQDLIAQEKVRAEKRELLTKLLGEIDASLLQIEREIQERRRIEIEGDGSEDDQTCKSRKLKPSTAPYKKCRSDLVALREARLLKERQLAELREAKRLEQIRKDQLLREKQERAEAERQRLALLQIEQAREAAERRERQREDAAAKDRFFYAKEQCRELGFKDKTEKFGTCVLELSKRVATQSKPSVDTTARGDGSPDDKTCAGYGYSVGTNGYADCRLKLDQARRDYERDLRAYEAERAAYDRRAAAIKEENERQAAEALGQYGMCLASCRGDFLSCSSRCGSGSAGSARQIGEPPAMPSGFTTYILNGKIINCSRLGSIVTCN